MSTWTGDEIVKNKMRAITVILVTVLLTGGLFAAITANSAFAASASVTVVINEFMADNAAAVKGPYGTYPDWIELYNYGDAPVDLSGMYLTDDLTNPMWRFEEGQLLGPKRYLLIWADGQPGRGPLHTSFRILANGGTLGLFASDRQTLIDYIIYDKQLQDVSYGRTPDGSSNWHYLTNSTAETANIANQRTLTSTPWPIWIVITIALVACIGVLIRDKIRARKKK